MYLSGPFVPAGTTIQSISGNTLTLSANATASSSQTVSGGSAINGSNILTVGSTANLAPNMTLAGAGIAANALISSILSPTTLLMSAAATATGSISSLTAFIPLAPTAGPGNSYTGATYVNGTVVYLNSPFNAIPGDLVLTGGNNQGTDTLNPQHPHAHALGNDRGDRPRQASPDGERVGQQRCIALPGGDDEQQPGRGERHRHPLPPVQPLAEDRPGEQHHPEGHCVAEDGTGAC
jgi:hypothetical protein